MPRPHRVGDTGDIAGLKCRDLAYDVSTKCRGCVGVLISRLNSRKNSRRIYPCFSHNMRITVYAICL